MTEHLKPTADVWVSRNKAGALEAIRVVDMGDDHLVRWVRYFRQKMMDKGASHVSVADVWLRNSIVTTAAIFHEVSTRDLWHRVNAPDTPPKTVLTNRVGKNLNTQLSASFKPEVFAPPASVARPDPVTPPGRLISFEDEV